MRSVISDAHTGLRAAIAPVFEGEAQKPIREIGDDRAGSAAAFT